MGFLWPWNRDAVTQRGALISQRGDNASSDNRVVIFHLESPDVCPQQMDLSAGIVENANLNI